MRDKNPSDDLQEDVTQLLQELNDISENLGSYFEFCRKRERNLLGLLSDGNLLN